MSPIVFSVLTAWCCVLSAFDIRQRRLPDPLTAALALGVFGYALFTTQFTTAALGAALLCAPYLVIHLVAPAAFGAGDVKLAVALGAAAALAGARPWTLAAIGAPVLTACAGIFLLVARRARGDPCRPLTVPHGPAMCLATLLALVPAL